MSVEWETIAGMLAGILGVALGVLSKQGRFRRWEPWYRNRELPFYIRNLAFAFIPFGIGALAGGGGTLAGQAGLRALAVIFVLIFFAAFAVGIAFMLSPPDWLKPEWIRHFERTGMSPRGSQRQAG